MTTPSAAQYRSLKAREPDALLLFRVGDAYVLFREDAERAAPLLGLTPHGESGAVAFPVASLEANLARLVAAGQRAAVCEQVKALADAAPAGGGGVA